MDKRRIFCSIVEGLVFEDRCLWKLRKVIDESKECRNCILRELELKSLKTKISKISSDIKKSEGIKRGPKKRSESVENEKAEEGYNIIELSKILGKAERTLRKWVDRGKIPGKRVDKKWYFPKEEVDRLFSKKEDATLGPPQLEEKEESPEFQKADFLPEDQGKPEKGI
jgi:excisionase family DNA binding protein